MGQQGFFQEAKSRLPEFKEPLNFLGVGAAWVAGDFVGHEIFEVTRGAKTAPFYYGNKLIWSIPTLLAGRLLSDYVVKGPDWARALTIATTANALMQIRYLATAPPDFNLAVFLIHEAILFPLAFLITGPSPVTGKY
jgi:hypothetical protein